MLSPPQLADVCQLWLAQFDQSKMTELVKELV